MILKHPATQSIVLYGMMTILLAACGRPPSAGSSPSPTSHSLPSEPLDALRQRFAAVSPLADEKWVLGPAEDSMEVERERQLTDDGKEVSVVKSVTTLVRHTRIAELQFITPARDPSTNRFREPDVGEALRRWRAGLHDVIDDSEIELAVRALDMARTKSIENSRSPKEGFEPRASVFGKRFEVRAWYSRHINLTLLWIDSRSH